MELPLIYAGVPGKVRKERGKAALGRVGLADRMGHRPSQMSGGQQQRVAIARALVGETPLILADEPTGNLDSKTSGEIMDLFVELNQEGKTIILVTHEPDIAEYSSRTLRFRDGRLTDDERRAPVLETLRTAVRSLLSNKIRSALTMLGIIIGVAAVITMVAIGAGASRNIQQFISGVGSNILIIMPGASTAGGVRQQAGSASNLTVQDAEALKRKPSPLRGVAPEIYSRTQLVYGNMNWSP